MTQSFEIMTDTETEIWNFFQDYAASLSPATASAYGKAIRSAREYFSFNAAPDVSDVADWVVAAIESGASMKTASYYLDNITSLYNAAVAEGLVPPSDAFKTVKRRLRAIPASANVASAAADRAAVLSRLRNIIRLSGRLQGDDALFADILTMSLLNPTRGIRGTAMLVRADIDLMMEEVREIAMRHTSSRRKYIFPLSQTMRTPRQVADMTGEGIRSLLRQRGIPVSGSADAAVETLWAMAALQCGFKASETVSALGHAPMALPLLSLPTPEPMPRLRREAIFESTLLSLIDNPLHWYVMHFRQGVRMETVRKRLDLFRDEIKSPEFYYPCEEIARKIGKKLVYKEKPLISDVAFFRCRDTEVFPLFRCVGDLAWCYREETAPGRPYSIVPDASMMAFMQTVGILAPGMEIYPIGEIPLSENDVVSIVGGPFIGKEATVESLLQNEQPTTDSRQPTAETAPSIVRLRITADNGIEWRVALPPHLLRPVSR